MRVLFWIVQGIFAAWIISALATTEDAASACVGAPSGELYRACEEGTQVGAFIGVAGLLFLWGVVNVILYVISRTTRKAPRVGAA